MNTFVTPLPQVGVPEGSAQAVRSARSRLARIGGSLWRAMQESGRNRARRELLDMADACQGSQPTLAGELRSAARFDPLA